jgi:hypothetical protein
MPLKLSDADLQRSAKSALSPVPPSGASRAEDREFAWDRFRASAAQAVLSDPDTMLYLKLRKMRGLVRPAAEMHGLLCTAVMLTELAVRPADVGVSDAPSDVSQIEAVLSRGTTPDLAALQAATAAAFRDEVKREVRKGYARPSDAGASLSVVVQEIVRRAEDLYEICVQVKSRIPDHRAILLATAAGPVKDRALLALSERDGLDRVLAVSNAVGALQALQADPPTQVLLSRHAAAGAHMATLMRALSGLLRPRKLAASRAEAAREVAFYGESASLISSLTPEASRAFGLLFLDTPDSVDTLGSLREISLEAAAGTVSSAQQLLKSCAAEGFDAAYRDLEMGNPLRLVRSGFLSGTRVGSISAVTGDLTYRSG